MCDPLREDQRVSFFESLGLPVVTIERDLARPDRPWVVRADNEGNTRALLDHLAAGGAERIALLVASGGWGWVEETAAAYAAWCADRGREPLIEAREARGGYEAALRLLDRARPDAIVSLAERHTNGVLRAAGERGLRIPEELRVATAIDSHQARDADVTAIDLHPQAQGEAAIALLLQRLAGERREAPLTTAAALRLRGTT